LVKTVRLPEVVNNDLTKVTEDLAKIAKKPISPAMTISLLIAVYRAHLSEPCARDAFLQKIATSDLLSPEEFEKVWDAPLKQKRRS
jgi:hypothetical protein